MTEREYKIKLRRIESHNEQILMRRTLREKKFETLPKFKLPTVSKLILILMVIAYFAIIIFACYEMHVLRDVSSLYALIGISASMSAVIWGYYSKSKIENSAGGIVYDMAMANMESNDVASG